MKTSLALLLLLLISSGETLAQQGSTELGAVVFEGNAAFPEDSLSRTIINRSTRCRTFLLAPFCAMGVPFSVDRQFLNERELSSDIFRLESYFSRRGYREIHVDTMIVRYGDFTCKICTRLMHCRCPTQKMRI